MNRLNFNDVWEAPVGRFLCQRKTVVSTGQNAPKQPVKNQKHMTSKRNKLYFAGTQLNLKTMVLLFPMPGLQRMILFLVEKVVTTSGFCLILFAGRGSDSSQLVKY